MNQMESNYSMLLELLGVDLTREGLAATPKRHVKFLREFCRKPRFKLTTFTNEGYDEMLVEGPIPFVSLCEHHVLPFLGNAFIGYIPDKRIVGLSKLPRVVDYCAAGLQTQERLTVEIANYLEKYLNPLGVGVILKAQHTCMSIRGVKKAGVITTTSCMRLAFRNDRATRAEFISFVEKD